MIKFNENVFTFQKIGVVIILGTTVFINLILFYSSKNLSREELKVNINQASFKELISIPYIGKKTAKRIINLRKKLGYIKSINQLKVFRNFKRFKYYIRVK